MQIKTGTRIEIRGSDAALNPVWFPAVIKRWAKVSGPREEGWHTVRFDGDKGNLLCHESGFRVVDNRA